MHNVDVEAVERTAARAEAEPSSVEPSRAIGRRARGRRSSARRTPSRTVVFEADFPPPMGGTGSAPNPLAYCFWGGLAAMG